MTTTDEGGQGIGAMPAGTVTFAFVDLEGSTRLLASLKQEYAGLLSEYYAAVEETFAPQGGRLIDRAGDGLFYGFPTARGAVAGALDVQRALADRTWPAGVTVRARIGIHTGEPATERVGYVGLDVHRAARIAACGHGGQILLSQTSRDLVASELADGVTLVDQGEHWLKDLAHPEHLYQIAAEGLQATFPPLRSLVTLPNNLPRHLNTFIGRRRELDEARDLLAEAPLLTLTGPGGAGKTRLAVQLAAEIVDKFADGTWLIELETLSDKALVPQTVASTLGVTEGTEADVTASLVRHLHTREQLLILDNCEHVVSACAGLANTLLRACPGVRILATSREALGVPGERLYPVRSLSLPEGARVQDIQQLAGFEAIGLFVQRARAADPAFQLDASNASAVVEICRRLDGIPLAIELAAARVRALSAQQIAARLDDRFRLLTGGSRTVLPRHQTLRAAMEWSFGLLPEEERPVLWRLSVFAGAFTLEAAEAVAAGGVVDRDDVVEHVTRLVEKSLVNRQDDGYRLLETIREYARDHLLEAGEAEETHARHRDWYVGLIEKAAPAFFRGPESVEAVQTLEREHDNLRAALQWSLNEQNGGASALRMAGALWRFWEIRGYLVEGRQWMERVLERTSGHMSDQQADILTGAGILAAAQGDHAAAMRYHEQSLALHQELGNRYAVTYALNNLANAALHAGDHQRARELYEETVARARALRDARALPITLLHVADVADRQGDYEGARERYREAIDLVRQHGDRWTLGYALGNYGETAARHDDRATARETYDEALRIYGELGDRRGEGRILTLQGELARMEDDVSTARRLLHRALMIRCELGDSPGICAALERLAGIAPQEHLDRAARVLGAASAMRERTGARLPMAAQAEVDQQLAKLQSALGNAFSEAWQQGHVASLEDALRDAGAIAAG